jgi:hypothetical protein
LENAPAARHVIVDRTKLVPGAERNQKNVSLRAEQIACLQIGVQRRIVGAQAALEE